MFEEGQGHKTLDSDSFIQQNHLHSCTTDHLLLLLREKGSFYLVQALFLSLSRKLAHCPD